MLTQLVAFTLDGQQYALRLACVQRIAPVVEPAPLPKAPEIILGVINLQGAILPVLNVRKRFGFEEREIDLSDRLIVARTARRSVALLVDSVTGVVERPKDEITDVDTIVPGAEYLEGVLKLENGILFIHDLDRFLSLDEENRLEDRLAKTQEGRQ